MYNVKIFTKTAITPTTAKTAVQVVASAFLSMNFIAS